jgi:hypothetical protein
MERKLMITGLVLLGFALLVLIFWIVKFAS